MEGIELVQCSAAIMKTALFLLNPRFDYRLNSPLQYPGIDFPREAEECDPPIVGTHPPVQWQHVLRNSSNMSWNVLGPFWILFKVF